MHFKNIEKIKSKQILSTSLKNVLLNFKYLNIDKKQGNICLVMKFLTLVINNL